MNNPLTKAEYDSYDYRNAAANMAAEIAIELRRQASFEPDYRHKQTDAQVLGMLVSHQLQWDGNWIATAFIEALHDANYHTEAEAIRKMFKLEEA